MKRWILGLMVWLASSLVIWGGDIRGDYEVVGPKPVFHGSDKILFEEFMNFGCPHCNHFHEQTRELRQKYEGRIQFVDRPILFRGQNDAPIRLYYVAQSLGKEALVKDELFKVRFKNGVDTFHRR